jgi:hypothetical protein
MGSTDRISSEEDRRKRFLEELSRAYTELREDETAWREEQAERSLWDQTLADGRRRA